jgi:hypothetical protein
LDMCYNRSILIEQLATKPVIVIIAQGILADVAGFGALV